MLLLLHVVAIAVVVIEFDKKDDFKGLLGIG